ncbi:hypothetical protein HDU91_003016 [Kappamyces sp. JEL0680]|nr:hypothetical protein HDU91_003016 [Kappamyces sp. JEL0680]
MSLSLQLLNCIAFSAEKHKTQIRKDNVTPYINHPVGVALILAQAGVDDLDVLRAAILHDTVEDTDCSFEELQAKFGDRVTSIVRECTDDKSLPSAERKRLQVVNAPHKSKQAKLVKLADKLYNLRDILRFNPWTKERAVEYFRWSKEVTDGCRDASETLGSLHDAIQEEGRKHFM